MTAATGLPSPAQYALLLDSQRADAYREATARVEAARRQRAARRVLLAAARDRRRERLGATLRRSRLLRALEGELRAVRAEMGASGHPLPTLVAADRVRSTALARHPEWDLLGPVRLMLATAEAFGEDEP